MYKIYSVVLLLTTVLLLCNCSRETDNAEKPLTDIYNEAYKALQERDYVLATNRFDEVDRQYPYSAWSAKAQLMSAYAAFLNKEFTKAIGGLEAFVAVHTAHPAIAYAYYLRALCYYGDIMAPSQDGTNTDLAINACDEVGKRFPNSKYAMDVNFKVELLKEKKVEKNMLVVRYYIECGRYISSLDRLSFIIENYPGSRFVPEALYRIIECYFALGIDTAALRAAAILRHNFPDSQWYKYSYNLLQDNTKVVNNAGQAIPLARASAVQSNDDTAKKEEQSSQVVLQRQKKAKTGTKARVREKAGTREKQTTGKEQQGEAAEGTGQPARTEAREKTTTGQPGEATTGQPAGAEQLGEAGQKGEADREKKEQNSVAVWSSLNPSPNP